jgi:1-acyl-sn-glycerol-3-phosphate acyltransferase
VTVLLNVLRVLAAMAWTAIVGIPVMIVIYTRWAYGMLQAGRGRGDVFDRVLEGNAVVTCWAAQRLWASVLLPLCGIRVRVRDQAKIDWSVSHVVCANHASLFDILALVRVVPPPFRFVAKRELLKWPVIGWVLRPGGQIVIDRARHEEAIRAIAQAGRRRIRGHVIFFVEGTRTRTGDLLPFRKGAFHFALEQQLPILPTAVCGSYSVLAKLPWWRLRPGRDIEIVFCSPVPPPALGVDRSVATAVEGALIATRASISAVLGQSRSAI